MCNVLCERGVALALTTEVHLSAGDRLSHRVLARRRRGLVG